MTIELTDPMEGPGWVCDAHPGWPLHVNSDCGQLAGVQPYMRDYRCSTCELQWSPDVLVSQHAECRTIFVGRDGSERTERATCLQFVMRAGEWVQVTYA